jgi:hypothetical protein
MNELENVRNRFEKNTEYTKVTIDNSLDLSPQISLDEEIEAIPHTKTVVIRKISKYTHLNMLLKKNYILFTRNWKMGFYQLVTPIFFCLLLVAIQTLVSSFVDSKIIPDPPTTTLPPIPHCVGKGCYTIVYGILVIFQFDSLSREIHNNPLLILDMNGFIKPCNTQLKKII